MNGLVGGCLLALPPLNPVLEGYRRAPPSIAIASWPVAPKARSDIVNIWMGSFGTAQKPRANVASRALCAERQSREWESQHNRKLRDRVVSIIMGPDLSLCITSARRRRGSRVLLGAVCVDALAPHDTSRYSPTADLTDQLRCYLAFRFFRLSTHRQSRLQTL